MRMRTQSKRTFHIIAAFYHRLKKEGVWGAMVPYPFKEKPASQFLYTPYRKIFRGGGGHCPQETPFNDPRRSTESP